MATSPSLASPEMFEALLGQSPPDGLLDATSAMVRRFCGWHIAPQRVDTLVVDGTGGKYLPLPTAHLTDVLSVVNDGTALDLANVEWSESGILKLRSTYAGLPGYDGRTTATFAKRLRGVEVRIQHGWNLADLGDISLQTVLIAARIGASPRGEMASAAGGVSSQFAPTIAIGASLNDYEQAQLAPYCVVGR